MKTFNVTKIPAKVFWCVILVMAVVSRFLFLTNKPVHFDEGINGWFVMKMSETGFYRYDPTNYHGPLYFYLLKFFELIGGRDLVTLRTLPVVFGIASLLVLSCGFIRSVATQRWIAILLLVSPAFVFFSRSGIHEAPFVFFQIVFALGVLRWMESPDSKALALALAGVFGMATLKETFAITVFCWGLAFVAAGWKNFKSLALIPSVWSRRLTYFSLLLIILFVLLFTGFLKNLIGLVDFVKAFLPWLKTGVGETGHNKEFLYWLRVLWEAEPLAIVGVGLALLNIGSKNIQLRAVSVFALAQLLIYSLIPYKTVWCILSLVWGFYFVIAFQIAELTGWKKWQKTVLTVVVVVATLVGFKSLYDSSYRVPISMDHLYVYVNTSYEAKAIYDAVLQNMGSEISIQMGAKEQWPYPWLYSEARLHYDNCGTQVINSASVYYCDADEAMKVQLQLTEPYMRIDVALRQSAGMSTVFLRYSDFAKIYSGPYVLVGENEEH